MAYTNIVVINQLDSGTAFANTLTEPSQGVFISAKTAEAAGLQVGMQCRAILVPNTVRPDRTPLYAISIAARAQEEAPAPVEPAKQKTTQERVRETMLDGGVWTTATMFGALFPGMTHSELAKEYSEVSAALRAIFTAGDCAKFSMWRQASQTKASKDWFTCYPDHADVDEWDE